MGCYTLTEKNFPNYSVAVEAELTALEERIAQAAELCQRLRSDNAELRRQIEQLHQENQMLSGRVDSARARLESLLQQIPE